jgi:hypothetical protein
MRKLPKTKQSTRSILKCFCSIIAISPLVLNAQTFPIPNKGDAIAGFRKTGTAQGNYEVVVNIGSITNLTHLAPGVQVSVTGYSSSQLTGAFPDYNNLQWSVSAAFFGISSWSGYPANTVWYTVPRTDFNTQSAAPLRIQSGGQSTTRAAIYSAGSGASQISSQSASNAYNTATFVREATGDPDGLTPSIGDPAIPSYGDWQGSLPFTVENTTPPSFTSPVRSDLYQAVPSGVTDPSTGQTTGNALYLGYFQFSTNGTMIFTRAIAAPPAPVISIARSGTTSTITFSSTSGATYTLFYTNSTGLPASASSWPSSPSTIVGDGSSKSFTNTSADPNRFYRVGAH